MNALQGDEPFVLFREYILNNQRYRESFVVTATQQSGNSIENILKKVHNDGSTELIGSSTSQYDGLLVSHTRDSDFVLRRLDNLKINEE